MPKDVIMPALGMAQDTGRIVRWLKHEGEDVAKGEPLIEIETDKVTVEVEAPADGRLVGIRRGEGEDVPVGEVVALVLGAGETAPAEPEPRVTREVEAVAASPSPAASASAVTATDAAPPRRRLASPKARRLARERGVDVETLVGSGPRGAVVAADIASGAPQVSSTWRTMAERVARSWAEVPHFYLHRDADATRLNSWREAARRHAETVTHTDLLVKVTAAALTRHPRVNATWRDGAVVPNDGVNISLAIATDDALVAPVVHGADGLSLAEIAARRRELVDAARAGKLRPDDVTGGTFTLSNLGMYGVDAFDAIVTQPQSGVLAVGRIRDAVVAAAGRAEVKPVLSLTVSFDHRVVDGARGAEFLDTLASLIEEPAGLVA